MYINLIGDSRFSSCALSAAVDKFVYIVINPTPNIDRVSARYSVSETVNHAKDIKNKRIKKSLLSLGINKNIEIGSFANIPISVGFRSNSSYTVCLIKGLHAFLNKNISRHEVADHAYKTEKKVEKREVGRQSQYASTFGGINLFSFSKSNVRVSPINLDFKKRFDFENRILVFHLRNSKCVKLPKRKFRKSEKVNSQVKKLASTFRDNIHLGNYEKIGEVLKDSWIIEAKNGHNVPPKQFSNIINNNIKCGILGGKYIGDSNIGCLFLIVEVGEKENVRKMIKKIAKNETFSDYREINISFVQSGVEIIFNSNQHLLY